MVVTPTLEDYEIVLNYSQSAMKMIYLATHAKLWAYQWYERVLKTNSVLQGEGWI